MLARLNIRTVPAVSHIDEALVLTWYGENIVALTLIARVLAIVNAEINSSGAIAGFKVCGSVPNLLHQVIGPHITPRIGVPTRAARKETVIDVTNLEQRSRLKATPFQL